MILDEKRVPRYANCSDDKDEAGNYQQHSNRTAGATTATGRCSASATTAGRCP